MNCFHCGRQVEVSERVGFRDTCPGCDRPLHVCLNCKFYDPTYNNQCRETQAERVVEKERANFCEYFGPRKTSDKPSSPTTYDARATLEALFKKKN